MPNHRRSAYTVWGRPPGAGPAGDATPKPWGSRTTRGRTVPACLRSSAHWWNVLLRRGKEGAEAVARDGLGLEGSGNGLRGGGARCGGRSPSFRPCQTPDLAFSAKLRERKHHSRSWELGTSCAGGGSRGGRRGGGRGGGRGGERTSKVRSHAPSASRGVGERGQGAGRGAGGRTRKNRWVFSIAAGGGGPARCPPPPARGAPTGRRRGRPLRGSPPHRPFLHGPRLSHGAPPLLLQRGAVSKPFPRDQTQVWSAPRRETCLGHLPPRSSTDRPSKQFACANRAAAARPPPAPSRGRVGAPGPARPGPRGHRAGLGAAAPAGPPRGGWRAPPERVSLSLLGDA